MLIGGCLLYLIALADPGGGNPAMPPVMVLGGLAPPSHAAAGSVKGQWIMEIRLFFRSLRS